MKKIFYAFLLLSVVFVSACKKGKSPNPDPAAPSKTGSTLDLIKDSIWVYAAEEYLWYNQLPSYQKFNPRYNYTDPDDFVALGKEMDALSQYAINPATNMPYEYYTYNPGEAKYSFIDNGTASAELNGTRGDFGFAPLYNASDNTDLRVKYVYPGSPADLAGMKRGYRITSINGQTNLTETDANVNFINNAFRNSNTISMTLLKPDGSTLNVNNMAIANYNVNPILKSAVYDGGAGHTIGYIVFNSFTSPDNADAGLDAVFQNFVDQGVTDLVVDLRYNGGGYVETAEYLDNLIAPAAQSGNLMYKTYYNNILENNKEVLLKNQWRTDPTFGDYNYNQVDYSLAGFGNTVNFAKHLNLAVNRVFFIITGATASASELTINNLRPVMNVQYIGSTSYGKPVGFFDININKYTMYTPEFYTQNSAGQGGYYSGFTPGGPSSTYPGVLDNDDVTKDFGDPTEGLLAHVIKYVKTGTYSVQTPVIQSIRSGQRMLSLQEQNALATKLEGRQFNGMIFKNKARYKR